MQIGVDVSAVVINDDVLRLLLMYKLKGFILSVTVVSISMLIPYAARPGPARARLCAIVMVNYRK